VSYEIKEGDDLFKVAQELLGDGTLAHQVDIPGWDQKGPLPVGQKAYIKGEQHGPPIAWAGRPRG
jgi:hypothetical protein